VTLRWVGLGVVVVSYSLDGVWMDYVWNDCTDFCFVLRETSAVLAGSRIEMV
jgi:hypothetical protein